MLSAAGVQTSVYNEKHKDDQEAYLYSHSLPLQLRAICMLINLRTVGGNIWYSFSDALMRNSKANVKNTCNLTSYMKKTLLQHEQLFLRALAGLNDGWIHFSMLVKLYICVYVSWWLGSPCCAIARAFHYCSQYYALRLWVHIICLL